jgi:hypothetical protein
MTPKHEVYVIIKPFLYICRFLYRPTNTPLTDFLHFDGKTQLLQSLYSKNNYVYFHHHYFLYLPRSMQNYFNISNQMPQIIKKNPHRLVQYITSITKSVKYFDFHSVKNHNS